MSTEQNLTRVLTGPDCRLSYAHLFTPQTMKGGDKPKYSVAVLIPKSDKATVKKIQDAIAAAEAAAMVPGGKWNGKKPKEYKYPVLRDGDGTDDQGEDYPEEYHGHWFVNAKSDDAPAVIGTEKDAKGKWKEITDPAKVYSGCYGRVVFDVFAYNHETGGKGLSVGLKAVQKIKDGEPLSGSTVDVNEAFDDSVLVDDDDPLG